MNNYAEITLGKETIGLTFGMVAAEEFYKLVLERGENEPNSTLAIADVIYCGAYNEASLARSKRPEYREMHRIVEDLYDTEDGLKQLNTALEIWKESKFGKNLEKTTNELKKKLGEPSQGEPIGSK